MMENNEPWKSCGSFHTPSWASFPKKRNVACPVFIMGLDSFEATVGDLHGQIVIMLYYLLAHFALRMLQSLQCVFSDRYTLTLRMELILGDSIC